MRIYNKKNPPDVTKGKAYLYFNKENGKISISGKAAEILGLSASKGLEIGADLGGWKVRAHEDGFTASSAKTGKSKTFTNKELTKIIYGPQADHYPKFTVLMAERAVDGWHELLVSSIKQVEKK